MLEVTAIFGIREDGSKIKGETRIVRDSDHADRYIQRVKGRVPAGSTIWFERHTVR